MELAPGGRYEIHNAGRSGGVSVLWDRSVLGVGNRFSENIRKVPGIQYVDARVTSQAGKETGQVLGEFLKERGAATPLRNAKAASASVWKNMPSASEIAANPALRNVAIDIEDKGQSPAAVSMRQKARREAMGYTGSILRNVANKVYASRNKTRNANPTAMKFRKASSSLNAIKQAETAAANAFYEKQKATGFGPAPTEPLNEAEKSVYRKELNRTQAIDAEQDKKREDYLNRKRREALGLHGGGT